MKERVYYKVIWKEYNYGINWGYWEEKENTLDSLIKARAFRACMESFSGQMAVIIKVTEKTEITE